MADITLTIPADKLDRVREAFLDNYPKTDPGISDLNHFKNVIKKWLVNVVAGYEERKVVRAAEKAFVPDQGVVE